MTKIDNTVLCYHDTTDNTMSELCYHETIDNKMSDILYNDNTLSDSAL